MVKTVLTVCLSLLIGVALVAGAFLFVSRASHRFDHPLFATFGVQKPEIIGFLPYWLMDRAAADYAPYLTTLAYFGLAVDIDGKPMFLTSPQEEEPGWTTLKSARFERVAQKAQEDGMKLSLLVHSADEDAIAQLMLAPETAARALVSEVAPIMQTYGFEDLNLDIESFLPASDSARANYTLFIETVAREVRAQNLGTITIELPPIALFRQFLMDPIAVGRVADRVVLMAYDYHYSGSFLAGPVAPLAGAPDVREFDVQMAVAEAVRVIDPKKIILGIPLYGYEWETISDVPGAATIPGTAVTASTMRIAQLLSECATCAAVMDPLSAESALVWKEEDYFNQIFYETAVSMQKKIELAQTYHLGGIALWALGYEEASLLEPLAAYKKSVYWRGLPSEWSQYLTR
jgi:spore germination protein YaaH